MRDRLLPLRSLPEVARRRREGVSPRTLAEVAPIVDAVRAGGEAALREYAVRFGDVQAGEGLFHDRAALDRALTLLQAGDRARLERVAERPSIGLRRWNGPAATHPEAAIPCPPRYS